MPPDERPTRQIVTERQAGDGVEITAARARQGYDGRSSRGILWVLVISFVLACAAMGVYWARLAPGLHAIDKNGGTEAHGQQVTDPNTVAAVRAPEPQPKQPPSEQAARTSGGAG